MIPGSVNLLLLKSAAAGGLQIERSLRFNSSDSAYLSRTPAVAGNRRTWTWAAWVKRSALGSSLMVLADAKTGSNESPIMFNESVQDTFTFYSYSSSVDWQLRTTQVFRDVGAWFHLVVAVDTTQATAANRVKIYLNGSQITSFAVETYPSLNYDTYYNSTNIHTIGAKAFINSYFPGYLANIHHVDGQQLTPSSFTETDATTGQLIPKTYTGSYGTNGFNLLFADNSSNTASTLGKDTSGNSNNWTPNNLSVTAGAGNDSLVDSPTNYGTDTGVGGEVRGNYATLNPLNNGGLTLANGNLDYSHTVSAWDACTGSICIASGKWYWEVTVATWDGSGAPFLIGIANTSQDVNAELGQSANSWVYLPTGQKRYNGSTSSYGASLATGNVVGIALDMDAGTLTFYKNGSSQGQAFTSITGNISPAVGVFGNTSQSGAYSCNFGQRAFAYTAPSGFKALCTQNLPAPLVTKSNTVFDAVLYTGNSGTQSITGLGFSPDFIWSKGRNYTSNHTLIDVIRGGGKVLISDVTDSEYSGSYIQSFDANGYTINSASSGLNLSGYTYVGWAWDAGTSTVSNTQGSITSQVRANATAGFSVVTWTGNGNATIGHGLGVAPQLLICKKRTGTGDWQVGHNSLGWTKRLGLNLTTSEETTSGAWNNTSPTSTVFTIGNTSNFGGDIVAYCFAPVVGYNSFGTYVANSSADGPFVYTGFRPKLVWVKAYVGTSSWAIYDSARNPYNTIVDTLLADSSGQENSLDYGDIDFLSNGFKIRSGSARYINNTPDVFIYCAWAEAPFNYSRAR